MAPAMPLSRMAAYFIFSKEMEEAVAQVTTPSLQVIQDSLVWSQGDSDWDMYLH